MTHSRGVGDFDTHDLPFGTYPQKRKDLSTQPKPKPVKIPTRQVYQVGKYSVTVNQIGGGKAQVFIDSADDSTVEYMDSSAVDSYVESKTK